MSDDQLKHLCLIAHACYNSFDLAGRCIALLEQRKAIPAGGLQQYIEILQRNSRARKRTQLTKLASC